MIIDGRAVAAIGPAGPAETLRDYLLVVYPGATIAPMDRVVLTAEPMVARVNHGTWIASCSCGVPGLPRPGCIVFLDTPLGWCVRCGNRAWGGGWRPLVTPPPDERRLIEAVLDCRPNVGDRNWEPGESIADLVAQNREHGDPIPDLAIDAIGPRHGPGLAETAAPFPSSEAMSNILAALMRHRRGVRRLLGR